MDIISYIHKSVALLFQILELVEVWTHRSMELLPGSDIPCRTYIRTLECIDFHNLIMPGLSWLQQLILKHVYRTLIFFFFQSYGAHSISKFLKSVRISLLILQGYKKAKYYAEFKFIYTIAKTSPKKVVTKKLRKNGAFPLLLSNFLAYNLFGRTFGIFPTDLSSA